VIELWFVFLVFTLTMFAVLDGWNIGAGAVHLIVARTREERREAIAALGPLWSWHEVWLVAAGGTFLLAFPRVMAIAFAGFYLALWMLLWALVLRGIAIEVGGHLRDELWESAWDVAFEAASVVLAILLGAAIGNVIRGLPLDATLRLHMPLFTSFGVRGPVGILDWYTVSTAVFTLILLAAHGASYLVTGTTGALRDRTIRQARRAWSAAAVLFPIVTWQTRLVRPDLFGLMLRRPLAWLALALACAGVCLVWRALRRDDVGGLLPGSSAILVGLLGALAAAVFPVILHSTISPQYALTAYNGAAGGRGLWLGLFWWPVAAALAVVYGVVVHRGHAHR
jgi:cytochrome d ubiquinol oxidase subunit II